MTCKEKEPILYMAMRLVNELLDADEPDFVEGIARAVYNADLGTLECMRDDLYERWS